jgi:two-component system sensor histidine kinase DesK
MDRVASADAVCLPPINWWPMIFSSFIVFYPLELLRRGEASSFEWALATFAVVSFVTLLAIAIAHWQRRRPFVWVPIVMGTIGFYLAGHAAAADLFFLFAAALFPWAVNGHVGRCVVITILLLYAEGFVAALVSHVPGLETLWLIDVPIFTIGNIASGVWIVGMTLSVRRLARVAEQERITHDLHGVLGDVLLRISARSAEARRVLEACGDTVRAREEMTALEKTARGALADVRQAIRRYRAEPPDFAHSAGRRRAVPSQAVGRGDRSAIDWRPMVFTIYVVYVPLGFWRAGGGTAFEWLLVATGVGPFFALVAMAIFSWQQRRPFLRIVFWIALLSLAFAPLTSSALLFLLFAAAMVPCAVAGDVSRTVALIALLIGVELLIGAWVAVLQPESAAHLHELWWIRTPILTVFSVAGYLWAVRMSLRYLALAQRSECERIARDLHDVLGHTLSLITLKSEHAGRLLAEPRHVERARAEIADVESISRQALAEVQRTIVGECAESLDAELERASSTLRAAGVTVDCQRESVWLDREHEGILGLALREAVTNIVRHAAASRCEIRFRHVRQTYVLEVQDDGRGGDAAAADEGLGLLGMRERIEALGGSVLRDISAGTRHTVSLPAEARRV